MTTPTKFLPVKMPKCSDCGDSGWKEVAPSYVEQFPAEERVSHANSVYPCPCDRGVQVADGYEIANEKKLYR